MEQLFLALIQFINAFKQKVIPKDKFRISAVSYTHLDVYKRQFWHLMPSRNHSETILSSIFR